MIRIGITAEPYEAIERTLALGSVAYEAEANAKGERIILARRSAGRQARRDAGPGGEATAMR